MECRCKLTPQMKLVRVHRYVSDAFLTPYTVPDATARIMSSHRLGDLVIQMRVALFVSDLDFGRIDQQLMEAKQESRQHEEVLEKCLS